MESRKIILDPTQYKEFGLDFFESTNFTVRYQVFNRIFWKNIYIPFGPIVNNLEGFDNFLQYLRRFKISKIKIDLPIMLDQDLIKDIIELLKNYGYHKAEYVQDEETLVVSPHNFSLSSRNMRYVRQGLKSYKIEIKTELNDLELTGIYKVYVHSANQIGFTPKPIEAFKRICENTITSIAYDISTNSIEGFLMGYCNANLIDGLVLQLIFTGLSAAARNNKVGFALHYELFQRSFDQFNIKMIDFHGASRNKNRSYTAFKENFGGEFVALPGSFEKINIF
jgi:hypothetical protein